MWGRAAGATESLPGHTATGGEPSGLTWEKVLRGCDQLRTLSWRDAVATVGDADVAVPPLLQ